MLQEAAYELEHMKPPLEPKLLSCCHRMASKDPGLQYLVGPCEELVYNVTDEMKKATEKCEKD